LDIWLDALRPSERLPWKDLFPPAIYYAEYGYAVPEIVHGYWVANEPKMQKTSEARRVFLPGGKAPELGAKFSNPDVAKALRLIAEQGRDAFYKGDIAQAIISTSAGLGGTMQLDDLADFSAEWVEPISVDYRGWKIYELPPNGQGMAALEMLNIMSTFQPDAGGPQGTVELHKKIEAMKLAYADLYRYNADPRFAKVPVQGLLSKAYAAQRAALINPNKANCNPGPGSPVTSDTIYLAAVDKEGNIASLIQATTAASVPALWSAEWASRCRTGERCSCSIPAIPTRCNRASGHFTRSFQLLWSRATCTSALASWVVQTSLWPTRSLSPTLWTTA